MRRLIPLALAGLLWGSPALAQIPEPPQPITVVDSGTACVTAPTACATFTLGPSESATIDISGTFTGTLSFEARGNGDTWTSVLANNVSTGGSATSTTAAGLFYVANVGFTGVRVRATDAVTGVAVVTATRGFASGGGGGGGTSGSVVVVDGTTPTQKLAVNASGQAAVTCANCSGSGVSAIDGAAFTAAVDVFAPAGGFFQTTATNNALTTGKQGMAQMTATRSLFTNLRNAAGTEIGTATTPVQVSLANTAANATAVKVDNSAVTQPVSVADNANVVLGAKADAKSTATDTTAVTMMQVLKQISASAQAPPSQAVTNAGTFATQATLTAETTKNIGTVRLADGAGTALTSITAGAQQAVTVSVVDNAGNQITSFGGSGGTASAFGSTFPSGASSGTAVGFDDGTNMRSARVVDADTGGGTAYTLTTNSVFRASGTPVEAGTSSNPWNVVFSTPQHVIVDTTSTTAVTQATAANLNAQVSGAAASGASKAGNPVQTGGVFNTTQPTVTNGQAVENQATARGAQIVATGTDTFNVTVNAALPAGSNTIGALTANQSVNVAQINGVTTLMGNGASGTGAQRVTIANDSTGIIALTTGSAQIGHLEANQSVNLGQIAGTTIVNGGTAGTQAIGGLQAADAAISGNNPVLIGGFGSSTLPTAMSASGDLTRPWLTLNGVVNDTPRTITGDAVTDDTLDAIKITNATAATATSYITSRLSDGTNFLTPSTDYTHDAALTTATTAGPMQMGRASAAAPTNVSANDDAVMAWYLLNGSGVTNIAAGSTLITATSTSLNVNCTGGCSGGAQYAEDTAHVSGDSLTMAGTVRQDTKGTGLGANGDNANIYVNANGEVYVTAAGNVAHDAAASTVAPVLVGAYASQAAPSDVSADTDAVRLWALRNGSLVSNLAAGGTLITATSSSLNVNLTNTAIITTAVGGTAHDGAASGVTPLLMGGFASAAAPADVSADNDAVRAWYLRNGSAVSNLAAGGTLITATSTSLNVNCTGGCSGGTQYTQDAALTVGSSVVTLAGGRASAAAPTNVSADNDAVMAWYLQSGAQAIQPTFGGVLSSTGTGAVGTGTARIAVGTDTATVAGNAPAGIGVYVEDAPETAAGNLMMAGAVRRDTPASSSTTAGDNSTINTDANGYLWTRNADPCTAGAKQFVAISQTTGTQLFTGTASSRTYVCQINLVSATAQNIALVSGTGTVCATSTGPMMGGTTAATGWNLAANGGIVVGSGSASVAKSDTDADNICILMSSTGQLSGSITYVVAAN